MIYCSKINNHSTLNFIYKTCKDLQMNTGRWQLFLDNLSISQETETKASSSHKLLFKFNLINFNK
jgi:hypothetical protein